ncbi:MAG: site-specific integrase [Clostridiales bacterium]|nr:site-specific integrase [Clostridiales bacterium]
MDVKRRDKKKRVLRTGESQRKDGRYVYKYVDNNGKQQFVYSWKLEPTDKLPSGKRPCDALRTIEKQIRQDLDKGIITSGNKITVIQLVEKYISQKTGVKYNTKKGYTFVLNLIKKEKFGNVPIKKVKLSDAKGWFIKLQNDGRGYSSIQSVRGVIKPAFQMAVDDDLLNKNPFEFQLATVVKNDSVKKEALTEAEEKKFLDFVANDDYFCKYYDSIYVLFKTGMRISEFTGLTISDIDLKNKKIIVNHQLQRKSNMQYYIEETKTSSGNREIPMTDDVYMCFKRIIANRKKVKTEPVIDGKCGFLFLDKNNMPLVALHWEKYFERICSKFNKLNKVQIPKVTPHICRHTYCSIMAKKNINPKVLQCIMGHADIDITLNTYTHLKFEDISEEVNRVFNISQDI